MAMAPPVVLPFIEEPVVVLLAAGPPACELPPAVAPGDCASASVPVSANAPANNIVVSFMGRLLFCMPRRESACGKLSSGSFASLPQPTTDRRLNIQPEPHRLVRLK